MSDVKRYSIVTDSLDIQAYYVLASDYNALDQRCRELEAERLELRAERDQLQRIARHLVRTYIVDDQACDPEAETNKAIAKILEQHK